MFFHIADFCAGSDVKTVNAVMLGILVPAVVDAAARHNHHIGILADEKVVVYDLFQAAFRHYDRYMHTFIFCARTDPDFQAAYILF